MDNDAIREALTPALLGEPMAAEVAALDGLPPPWMAVLGALGHGVDEGKQEDGHG